MTVKTEKININKLNQLSPEDLIKFTFDTYGDKACISTSFQKTGIVIIDKTSKLYNKFKVTFIDTYLNYDETYKYIEHVEKYYGITIEKYNPDQQQIEDLNRSYGQYPYLFSQTERQNCCQVRKVEPARRMERNYDAIISGLRKDQSKFRAEKFSKVYFENKENHKFLRVNPLFDWTEKQINDYIKWYNVPINPLYNYESKYGEKYEIIGCKCCHFPVQSWRKKRAGKFPWEKGKKECGIHFDHGAGI